MKNLNQYRFCHYKTLKKDMASIDLGALRFTEDMSYRLQALSTKIADNINDQATGIYTKAVAVCRDDDLYDEQIGGDISALKSERKAIKKAIDMNESLKIQIAELERLVNMNLKDLKAKEKSIDVSIEKSYSKIQTK